MITFAEKYPKLVVEWALENEIRPEDISYGSNKIIIWNGSCGHTWAATIKNRGHGHGCPYCTGNRVLKGYNDLATRFSEIASEWSERNFPMAPEDVTPKANKSVWWKCNRCGYEWQARIADRTDGHGCPVCAGEKLIAGVNDFASEYPELAEEWSGKNKKSPSQVWPKSRENVWWRCGECGHEWMAVIDSRVKGSRCPECVRRERLERIPYHNALEKQRFRNQVIMYYARKAGARVLINSDDVIGVKLDIYFPEQKAAVVFSRSLQRDCLVRRERAVNWLCLNAGIRLFRILDVFGNEYDNCICITLTDRSLDVLSAAVQAVFDMTGLDADVDIERDLMEIKNFC